MLLSLRKMPASCWLGRLNRWPSLGAVTVYRKISVSISCPEDFDHFDPDAGTPRCIEFRYSGPPEFRHSSTVRKASHRTTAFYLGEAPGGAGGVCRHRVQLDRGNQSFPGGAGKVMAEWIRDGRPPLDLWDVDIRRALSFQSNMRFPA
ncbi:MAG: hypothetical protein Ct9H300mP16_07130 [Pseudomonadota bacterium]|nr:MAG: hypothetical protein Ct9H300mP16_07130 [Pseudomonadota bacterium]